jgi:deoxyhypusine monooxygenase
MARHKAAKAMGARGFAEFLPILEKYAKEDPSLAIVDTCVLAIDRINYVNDPANKSQHKSVHTSVDPAPPAIDTNEVKSLEAELSIPSSPFLRDTEPCLVFVKSVLLKLYWLFVKV